MAGVSLKREDGALVLTAALDCPVGQARSLAVSCAVWPCEAVGGGASIRWPNHVVKDGADLCAIECRATGDDRIVLTYRPRGALPLPEEDLFDRVASAAERDLADFPHNSAALLTRYCERCDTIMKFVDTTYRGMPLYGFAFAVDKHGGLMVMTQESHTVVTLYGGEAAIVGKRDPEPPDLPVMA